MCITTLILTFSTHSAPLPLPILVCPSTCCFFCSPPSYPISCLLVLSNYPLSLLLYHAFWFYPITLCPCYFIMPSGSIQLPFVLATLSPIIPFQFPSELRDGLWQVTRVVKADQLDDSLREQMRKLEFSPQEGEHLKYLT